MNYIRIRYLKRRRYIAGHCATKTLLLLISLAFLQDACAQQSNTGSVVDTSITGFHYATNFSGTLVYTQHGPSDIDGHTQPTAFSITPSGKVNFEGAKHELSMLLQMSHDNGYKISDLQEKDTLVKGRKAFYISYTETLEKENYQNFVFNGVVSGDGAVVVFTSGDLDKGKFIDLFKKTFYQLSL
jgi:hypothetical protein